MSTEATPIASTPAPAPAEDWVVTTDRATARVEAEAAEQEKAEGLSKAASELGKKGGEAAAAKREAEAKEAKRQEKAEPEGDEPEPEKATEEKPDRRGNPRHDPKARVQEATREAAEHRRAAEQARQELARERAERERLARELEATRTGKPAEEKPEPRQASGEPKEEDFEDYREYLKALAKHEVRQEREQAAQQERAEAQHRHILGRLQNFTASMRKAAESDPEFIEKTEWIAQACRPSDTMAPDDPGRRDPRTWIADELVHNPESAPALALYLQEHRDEFQRIATLSSRAAVIREMAKIVTRLDDAPTDTISKPVTVSKAKPPVKPVTGSPPTAGEPDPAKSSYDDYVAYHNAAERVARRR